MNHESRILQDMLIARKMDVHEFKERIDATKPGIYMNISEKFMQGEISEDEFVEQYNRLVEQEAEKHWEPVEPHEHI
jgi:hypothetical protein